MKIVITIVFLSSFIVYQSYGQVPDTTLKVITTGNWIELSYRLVNDKGEPIPFVRVEEMPSFPGGFDALSKFIKKNLDYPKSAIKDSIQGRVITSFILDENGKVVDVKNIKSVRNDLDSACIHVVRMFPRWKTAKNIIENQRFQLYLPVKFVLTSKLTKHR